MWKLLYSRNIPKQSSIRKNGKSINVGGFAKGLYQMLIIRR